MAGGHNAPPRGAMTLTETGEPLYGERDLVDFEKFRELGLPFWLAGGYGTHDRLKEALEVGAEGIQVGTGFAFCQESGILPDLKAEVVQRSKNHEVKVFTDPKTSPTGFPFKVLEFLERFPKPSVYAERQRICDLGYLRTPYRKEDDSIGYRCASEPVEDFVAKGGDIAETEGRKCVCNGLMGAIGLSQVRKGVVESTIMTAGDDVSNVSRYLKPGQDTYTASDVIQVLLGKA